MGYQAGGIPVDLFGVRGWLARRTPSSDDGFTLVEMLASLIVIALVASAFVVTFTGAALASQWNERRTDANQLGQQRLETVVSQPWSSVGLYAAGAGYRATSPAGETTVALPAGPTVASVPVPLVTATVKQVGYSVRTDVTWRDDPADGLGINDRNGSTQDIKHVTISITFGLGSRQSTVSFDGLRGANAIDVPPASATTGMAVTVAAPSSQLV